MSTKKEQKKFLLADYKGKYTVIIDEDREDMFDVIVGEITKKDAIKEARERIGDCNYYGIPAYVGSDEDLNKIYNP